MSFRKGILCVSEKYQRFPSLFVWRNLQSLKSLTRLSKPQNLFSRSFQNVVEVGCLYDTLQCRSVIRMFSAVNEKIIRDRQYNVIDVQPLQFEEIKYDDPVPHDDLLNVLKSCKSVEEQMIALTSKLSLTNEDFERRIKFAKKIESLLKPFFLDIKIQIFGSTVNGFGFKGCDLDMSFETPIKEKLIPFLERPDVPLVGEVISGKVTPQELSELPPKEQLLFIHSLLQEYYNESSDPTIFINAYVPLVRFYHDKYSLKCDLSCRNKVAFANTKLLYLFGKLDDRVIPLMMTIRYWAKHVELIGKGLLFNTYTISLMVIYFLQTRKPSILPSAKFILSISNSLEIEDMNDTSFLELKNVLPVSENKQTLGELLKEFFLFYLYFDFTRVICPLISRAVPREEFFTATRDRKFRMNTICVQDPMLPCHNVAELVDYRSCKRFFNEVMLAYKFFENSDISSKLGLIALFDRGNLSTYQNMCSEKVLSITLPLIKSCLKPEIGKSENTLLVSAQKILQILQHALLFNCQVIKSNHDILEILERQDEMFAKQRKIFQNLTSIKVDLPHRVGKKSSKAQLESDNSNLPNDNFPTESVLEQFKTFNASHVLLSCAECKASRNVWLGRDFIEIDSDHMQDELLDQEHFISICAAKQNEQNFETKAKPVVFLCECYVSPQNPDSSLLVNFRPLQKTHFNPVVGIFLKEYLPKLIKRMND